MALSMKISTVKGERTEEEIQSEILAVIAAAATAFLGINSRIRSARLINTAHEPLSRWSQQGRKFVQASHNLPLARAANRGK